MELSPYRSSPSVSVVMPVYNGARTLRESVDSVLAQSFSDFEFIICNDASTDETGNMLTRIADGRVKVLHNATNMGEGSTRDRAIAAARGDWLAFIDADDAWVPERLEALLSNADTFFNKMIFDDILECHDTPTGMVPWHVLRGPTAFGGDGSREVEVPIDEFVCQKRLLIKPLLPLGVLRQDPIYHSSSPFGADTEFFLRILARGLELCYVPKPMYHYRITPGSMSGSVNRSILMREVLENAIDLYGHAPAVQFALQKKLRWSPGMNATCHSSMN